MLNDGHRGFCERQDAPRSEEADVLSSAFSRERLERSNREEFDMASIPQDTVMAIPFVCETEREVL